MQPSNRLVDITRAVLRLSTSSLERLLYARSRAWRQAAHYSAAQPVHHEVDDMLSAFADRCPRTKIPAKDGRERVKIVEVEEAESRDGHVDLTRVDAGAEGAVPGTPLQHLIQHADER